MPFDVQKAKAKQEKTLTVDIEGDVATVTYQPAAFTIGVMAELQMLFQASEAEETDTNATIKVARQMALALDRLLVEWDLTNGDEPIPPTAEAMEDLEIFVLMPIGAAIMDDMNAGKARTTSNGASAAGSSTPTSTRRNARTGTRTSS